jgi:hypothetical protein
MRYSLPDKEALLIINFCALSSNELNEPRVTKHHSSSSSNSSDLLPPPYDMSFPYPQALKSSVLQFTPEFLPKIDVLEKTEYQLRSKVTASKLIPCLKESLACREVPQPQGDLEFYDVTALKVPFLKLTQKNLTLKRFAFVAKCWIAKTNQRFVFDL